MRGARFVVAAGAALVILAAAGVMAPVVLGESREAEARARTGQDRLLSIAGSDGQMLTAGGPQIGVTVRNPAKGEGAEVTEVRADSPAAKAGFRTGDLIVEFDGERVRSVAQLTRLVRETPAGRAVRAAVMRDGKRVGLSVAPEERAGALEDQLRTLDERLRGLRERGGVFELLPPDGGRATVVPPGRLQAPLGSLLWLGGVGRLGVTVEELTGQLASYFGAKDGVLVTEVAAGTPAEKAGLKAGDVITSVNDKPVTSGSDLVRLVREAGDGAEIAIGIVRDRKPQRLQAKLGEAAQPRRGVVARRGIRVL